MRQFIRHPSTIPIHYQLQEVVGDSKEYLRNISEGGLCFISHSKVELGVMIDISIPLVDPRFHAAGMVVWCHEKPGGFEVGVHFDNPQVEFAVRMVEQVCQIEQYKQQILEQDGRKLSGEEAAMEWIENFADRFPR